MKENWGFYRKIQVWLVATPGKSLAEADIPTVLDGVAQLHGFHGLVEPEDTASQPGRLTEAVHSLPQLPHAWPQL